METSSIPVEFDFLGTHYKGWATPSARQYEGGAAKSYHVVLNEVFFGNLSRDHGKWLVDEQRPHDLIVALGECLDAKEIPSN